MKVPRTVPAFIFHFVRKHRVAFLVLLITNLIWSANMSLFPFFLKIMTNTLAQHSQHAVLLLRHLSTYLMAFIGLWILMEIAMRVHGIVYMRTMPRLKTNIRLFVFKYVLGHSHDYFSSHFSGGISGKINDLVNATERVLEILLFNLIAIGSAFLIACALLWSADPIFCFIFFAWAFAHMSIILGFMPKNLLYARRHAAALTTVHARMVDSISNVLSIRLFSRQAFEYHHLKEAHRTELKRVYRLGWRVEKMKVYLGIATATLIFSTLVCLVYGYLHQRTTLGDVALVGMLTFNVLGWVWYASYQVAVFIREVGKVRGGLAVVRRPHAIVDRKFAKELVISRGDIVFDHVTFGYSTHRKVFDQFSTQIHAGEKVGLVGFSGSGKTTFISLLMRFFDISSGAIFIDDQDISTVTQDSLHRQIALIPQDTQLFHRSLIDNIRYGCIEASDEAVIKAAKMAFCHEFIMEIPGNYWATVGERGIKLSGGQRQRIAIARAILKNAPILVLDEATSSLDSVTEKQIQHSLFNLMQHKTAVVIAHRLSTLGLVDRILVFHEGHIVEEGRMSALIEKNGHFAKLWQLQKDGFLPEQAV